MNVGQQLHGNRFGDLERCAAIGVYLIDMWEQFLSTYTDVRNQLATFLRSIAHLKDICSFLWLGAALFGYHVTEPYLNLLIDMETPNSKLLIIFPQMYNDLLNPDCCFTQFEYSALPSLSEAWLPPFDKHSTPYTVDIMKSLQKQVELSDINLLNKYIHELCSNAAERFARQRGPEYGFGGFEESEKLLTKQLSKEELTIAPTHTKPVENFFGVVDHGLEVFGPQAFQKLADYKVIRTSVDLISDGKYRWRQMKEVQKELDNKQEVYSDLQKELIAAGVKPEEVVLLATQSKIQRVVGQCKKSHFGPIDTEEELDSLIANVTDKKVLAKKLALEIWYQKFTRFQIKETNPLFKQRNLSPEEMERNL